MKNSPTFLVLDDDEDNRFLTRHALRKAFPDSRVIECATVEDALVAVRGGKIDGLLTDHHLGTAEGPTLVRKLRTAQVECPIVMVTANSDPNIRRRAFEAGAVRVFAGSDMDFVAFFRTALGGG